MNFKIKALAALFGLVMASAATAGTVFYTDAATYAQAVTSTPAITFDGGTGYTDRGNHYTTGGVTFKANRGIYSIYSLDYDAAYHNDAYLDLEGQSLYMEFNPTNSFSFEFAGFYSNAVSLNLKFSNGATYTANSPANGYAFFGVTSDDLLTQLTIKTTNDFTAFDNVALGTATVPAAGDVPEPGSVALLGLALFGLVGARRKFSK